MNLEQRLKAAGLLGLPFSWSSEGELEFSDDMTSEQISAINAVFVAHKAAPVVSSVPQSVTMRQARLALLAAGKLSAVNTAISAMTGATGEAAKIEWEYSGEVRRDKALLQALAVVLNLNNTQLDELFVTAATL